MQASLASDGTVGCERSTGSQSDFQSGVDKQKNQLTLDLMGQNLALC